MLAPDVTHHPAAVRLADLDQRSESIQRDRDISSLLRDDDEAVVLVIIGERNTKPVEDAPTGRWQKPQIDAVLVRQHRIPIRLQDLELIHAPGERTDQDCLADAES